jgi:4,4'-diaponeurosporenoate glycosyltransferase
MLILAFVLLALWAAGFMLLPRLRPCQEVEAVPARPSVSMVIPARDEEHNLPTLLHSLAAQSVRPGEILVVDDGSTDRTAAVAGQLGARVIPSQPLPAGWRGKTWACHHGAQAASGELLCFADADTCFEADGLARLFACYEGGAFSLGPWHAIRKPYENLSLFFNLNMVAGTVPGGLFGQLLLVDRESYHRVGGHAAVRGRILENFRLAQEFSAAGVPVRSAVGRGVVSFRMYPGGIRELIAGWIKGFASGAGHTPRGTLILMVAWMSALMTVPIAWLVSGEPLAFGLIYLLCAAQVAWFGRRVGAFHWVAALLYPVPLVFFFVVFALSSMRAGKTVIWKGREIHAG